MAKKHQLQSKNKLLSEDRSKGPVAESKSLTRRDFITRSVGAVGLLAILSSPFLPALTRAKARGITAKTAATKEKVRAWCMAIDLKKCEGCVTH